jgi:hypothetical protein
MEISTQYSHGPFQSIVPALKVLYPMQYLEKAATDDESGGFSYSVKHSDEVLRLLWLAMALANAVGKGASLKDALAALGQDMGWTSQLSRDGLTLAHKVANFDSDVGTVVFHATTHMNAAWPRRLEFQHDGTVKPRFTLEVKTPSGGFQPVRTARIKLNGNKVAEIAWPATARCSSATPKRWRRKYCMTMRPSAASRASLSKWVSQRFRTRRCCVPSRP